MAIKKIIPCLDVKDGKVVKGVHFENVKTAGDVIENARFYSEEGADEIVFLDISATIEGRKTMVELVREVAKVVSIPFIVGGGIKSLEDIERLIDAGVNKISINTAAVRDPSLVQNAAKKFGSESVIIAIDAKRKTQDDGRETWEVYINSGQTPTGIDAVEWAKKVEALGAGALLPTSIDKDGTKEGYDIELTKNIKEAVKIPVIASGGAGTLEHIYEVLTKGKADAALCASIFHFRDYSIKQAKEYLREKGIQVRI